MAAYLTTFSVLGLLLTLNGFVITNSEAEVVECISGGLTVGGDIGTGSEGGRAPGRDSELELYRVLSSTLARGIR